MINLIAAEFVKLRTTRTFIWVSLLALALVALVAVVNAGDEITNAADLKLTLSSIGACGVVVMILGVIGAAGEFRHKTITTTLLVSPVRVRVLTAKAVAYALAGLVIAGFATALVFLIALAWLSDSDASFASLDVPTMDLTWIVVGSAAYLAISGVLGVGLGGLLTNQVVAVVLVMVFTFIVDPLLTGLVDGYSRYSLLAIGNIISGGTSDVGDLAFSPLVSGLIYLGYAAVALGAAALVSSRRDVA